MVLFNYFSNIIRFEVKYVNVKISLIKIKINNHGVQYLNIKK